MPSRIEVQVRTVLELLERHKVTATFFILGWIAEHHPNVVREIARAGHEIGCHSHLHRLIFDLTAAEFRKDTEHAVRAIQNACGVAPRDDRAPCFSLTTQSMWALEILVENGFTLDLSVSIQSYMTAMEFPVLDVMRRCCKRPRGPYERSR